MKSLISIHDTECQFIKTHGAKSNNTKSSIKIMQNSEFIMQNYGSAILHFLFNFALSINSTVPAVLNIAEVTPHYLKSKPAILCIAFLLPRWQVRHAPPRRWSGAA